MSSPILIVEDSVDDATKLRRELNRAGLCNPCYVVNNGTEALRYLTGQGHYADRNEYPMPRVILLDLKMPELDGFELLRRLKTMPALGDALIIAVSGLDDLESIRRAYGLGARSFLAKPCQAVDVKNLIQGFPNYWSRTAGS